MSTPTRKPTKKLTAQAMVEFALALPILLLIMYGLIETGRLVFIYASVVTAARQAVRYGSATGINNAGTPYYNDCGGIKSAAEKMGFLQRINPADIGISYDNGPSPTWQQPGCPIDPTVKDHPANGDRIRVDVSAPFSPIVPLVPFKPFTIKSFGYRTLLVGVSVAIDQPAVVFTPGSQGVLNVVKTSSPKNYDGPNQVINYTYTLTNLGTLPVYNVSLVDDKVATITCPPGSLAQIASGTSVSCTGSYTTTQTDVNNKSLTNTVKVTYTSEGVDIIKYANLTINFIAKPKLLLGKSGVAPTTVAAGQLIAYTFTLKNIGNVQLQGNYTITDSKMGNAVDCTSATSPLNVNDTTTCTGSYALKNTDITAGKVDNSATATAYYGTFTVTSNTANATVAIPPLNLDLGWSLPNGATGITALGQTITYTYTVTNRSTKTMNNITVSDTRGANKYTCSNWSSVAPGASPSCTRTYSAYTQADMDSGAVVNQAVAAAASYTSNTATTSTPVTKDMKLQLTKTGSTSTATTLGAKITYTYSLKNIGNVTLGPPFKVTDNKIPAVDCSALTGTMAPNATGACANVVYTVTQADLDAGSIINTATATAMSGTTMVTSNESKWQVITFTGERLGLAKTSDPTYFTGSDQRIKYIYTLKNTGGIPINGPFAVNDNLLPTVDCSGASGPIPIGGSTTCIAYYTTTDTDTVSVTNSASATAEGGTLKSPTVQLTVPKFLCDESHLKHLDPTPIPSGSDIVWTIVNNTGRPVSLTSISVTWDSSLGTIMLNQVLLAGSSIWGPSSASEGNLLVPNGPWTVGTGTTNMGLKFSATASSIRIYLTFGDGCTDVDSSKAYP